MNESPAQAPDPHEASTQYRPDAGCLSCPHCQSPVAAGPSHVAIACPSCGGLVERQEATTDWKGAAGPRQLGRFTILSAVGAGACGTVYKAHDPQLDRPVAIKVPHPGRLETKDEFDRFLREARSVARMSHRGIVPVHEVGVADGTPFIVSAFVEGLRLEDLLTARRPSVQEAAGLTAALADALQYAHDHGVVHRDVKPSNIMIGPDNEPLLMDFGLAKRDAGEATLTIEGQVLGTPAYMSPEQARGEAHQVDGRSDVYSLGVIL